jgi:hypothetical protein
MKHLETRQTNISFKTTKPGLCEAMMTGKMKRERSGTNNNQVKRLGYSPGSMAM